jgi:hypothetical protein
MSDVDPSRQIAPPHDLVCFASKADMASPPHAIKVMDTIWSGALQLLDRFAHERVKAGAAGVEMEEHHLAIRGSQNFPMCSAMPRPS